MAAAAAPGSCVSLQVIDVSHTPLGEFFIHGMAHASDILSAWQVWLAIQATLCLGWDRSVRPWPVVAVVWGPACCGMVDHVWAKWVTTSQP